MLGRLKKALVCAMLTASAIGWFSAPAQAAPAQSEYFKNQCDSGRACILLRGLVANPWWNADHCGDNPVHDYYQLAVANGNFFRVYYANGTSVAVPAWEQRGLDPNSLVVGMRVDC
jgi:hypothetical protein